MKLYVSEMLMMQVTEILEHTDFKIMKLLKLFKY
jgi:hypothetical protein